jgi:hypothetical protein
MTKYELGIMSSKWVIEADSLDIAVMTLRLAQRTTAPIVCYNSPMQSKFMIPDRFSVLTLDKFMDKHGDDVRIAYRIMEVIA